MIILPKAIYLSERPNESLKLISDNFNINKIKKLKLMIKRKNQRKLILLMKKVSILHIIHLKKIL